MAKTKQHYKTDHLGECPMLAGNLHEIDTGDSVGTLHAADSEVGVVTKLPGANHPSAYTKAGK